MFSKLLRKLQRRTAANNALSAPLAHLLTSNNPPTDVEETVARNTIQALQDSLTVLQLDIDNYPSDPRTAATDLEGHKAAIIKSITAHGSIISPLRKLPPELLQVIFQKTYWDPATTFTLPWSLSQVCRSWRMIIHATPILWSCISIVFHLKPTRLRPQKARLKFILQRSFNVDLRVSIRGCVGRLGHDKRVSLLLILMAHSERWGYLDLDFSDAERIMSLQAVKKHLPRLSQLHMKFMMPPPMTIDMFSLAPRLETVVLINVSALKFTNRVIVPLPFQQLSSYVRTVFGELVTSLATFSHLVHLETVWERTIDPLEPRITFPHLTVLVIYFSKSNSANGFFERLILPCISELVVQGHADGVTIPISSMISRSLPCNLRTLPITDTTLRNRSHLTSLLLLTPQLEDLRILLSSHLDVFATLKSPVLLPKLQSLFIVVPFMFPLSFFSPLTTFIATQVEMPSYTGMKEEFRLRTLRLSFASELECRAMYFVMQRSPEVDELDDDVLALINSWKKILVEDIPCLSFPSRPRPTPKEFKKLKHWRRLDQLFNAIEGYNIPKSGYLHVSKLHLVMQAIKRFGERLGGSESESKSLRVTGIPGNKHYHFSSRAKALLARWEPILLQDVHYYKWLNTDRMTLTYVPKQADLRKSSSAIDLIYSRARMCEFYV